jgi:hypothetical protein
MKADDTTVDALNTRDKYKRTSTVAVAILEYAGNSLPLASLPADLHTGINVSARTILQDDPHPRTSGI